MLAGRRRRRRGKFSYKKTLIVLAAAAFFDRRRLSLMASSSPDGLEWSIERVTGSEQLEAQEGVYGAAASVQEKTAVLPDYSFRAAETAAGTSFSGIAGGAAVAAVCFGVCELLRFSEKKRERSETGHPLLFAAELLSESRLWAAECGLK